MTGETLPESILQFGGGRFLRSFADAFVHEANRAGQRVGRVVVVQSTDSQRARLLNEQGGRYHVLVRGIQDGKVIDRVEDVASVSRALRADCDWAALEKVVCSPDITTIISNTTEAGYTLDSHDESGSRPPRSFPAKLLSLLRARFDAKLGGPVIVPCELFESNAKRLLGLLLEQAAIWGWSGNFLDWLRSDCRWLDNLVDRIVTDAPPYHPLAAEDRLLSAAEPFALWAVEAHPAAPLFQHAALERTDDVKRYFLRKVRILNGAHTALASWGLPQGFRTVREALEDPEIRSKIDRLLSEEIVPVLADRVDAPVSFARQALERFQNPFLEHELENIAIYHDQKIAIRLVPTRDEYVERFGRRPELLDELTAAS